ncbi:MAG: 1-acyl-sn-glycerol-3-phosphate acyltransferase [Gemmatimonadales bacterium]|nr:1-acyl-sn-glycerol-3-phosphate acyltransferase [Gemmatimonadales bacterium]
MTPTIAETKRQQAEGSAPPAAELRGGHFRAVVRIAGIVVWTAALTLLWTIGNLLTLPFPRPRRRWRHNVVKAWARGFGVILGMRVRVEGRPPKAPFFLVSNHLTYVDIILLHGCLDGVFIAKREMRHWPVLGPLANLFGTIWVNREVRRDAVRVIDAIDEAVARGDGVILFAEGTTSAGDGILPMRPALFDWAAREQFPVHYAALTYRTPPGSAPARLAICWWADMPFGPHAYTLCRLRRFEASVEFGPEPIVAPTRGELAQRVHQAISGLFVPVTSERTARP